MSNPLTIDIVTIFPHMLDSVLGESMLRRARESGRVIIRTVNLRDFTDDRHRTTDDRPYGGGPGMIMKPEPLFRAVESIRTENSHVLLMTPQGRPFVQARARELAQMPHLIMLCGHYEGIDERVRLTLADEELSIGDYVLTNGVLPAAVVTDAVTRLLPGVLGAEDGTDSESFTEPLLECEQYTRPPVYKGMAVPEILRSGDHAAIAEWRKQRAEERTRTRRPDLN